MVALVGVGAGGGDVDVLDGGHEVARIVGKLLGLGPALRALGGDAGDAHVVELLLDLVRTVGDVSQLVVGVREGVEGLLVGGGDRDRRAVRVGVLAGKAAHRAREARLRGVGRRGCAGVGEVRVPGMGDGEGDAAHHKQARECGHHEGLGVRHALATVDALRGGVGLGGDGALDARQGARALALEATLLEAAALKLDACVVTSWGADGHAALGAGGRARRHEGPAGGAPCAGELGHHAGDREVCVTGGTDVEPVGDVRSADRTDHRRPPRT